MTENERQQIHILLQEYNTLRTEIIQKSNAVLQGVTVTFAVFFGIVTVLISIKADVMLYGFALLPFVASTFFTIYYADKPIGMIAARLRELEILVNTLAGAELLIWETHYGYGGVFDHRASDRAKARSEVR